MIGKKFLFASGGACQSLIFLCASNIDYPFKIINGNGHGTILQDDKKISKKKKMIQNTDYILDKVTGDMFTFNHQNEKWVSLCNTGLHHSQSAQKFGSMGKFI